MELTVAQMERMTGISYKAIKRRLGEIKPVRREGAEIFFSSKDALTLLFAPPSKEVFDLTQQRARLAKMQADKIELEIAKMRESLVDVAIWTEEWAKMLSNLKDKFRTMALRMSDSLAATSDSAEIYDMVMQYSMEALEDIAKDAREKSDQE